MESAYFFIFTTICHSYHTGYGKQHSTPTKSNTLPQLIAYPCLVSTYTERLPYKGGASPNTPKLFLRKKENFLSIRKCNNREKSKVHLPQ